MILANFLICTVFQMPLFSGNIFTDSKWTNSENVDFRNTFWWLQNLTALLALPFFNCKGFKISWWKKMTQYSVCIYIWDLKIYLDGMVTVCKSSPRWAVESHSFYHSYHSYFWHIYLMGRGTDNSPWTFLTRDPPLSGENFPTMLFLEFQQQDQS